MWGVTPQHRHTKKGRSPIWVATFIFIFENEVVRREAVLSRFWGVEDKDYFASRSLDVFIKKIRTALEDEPGVELKTIRGVGFKLIAE